MDLSNILCNILVLSSKYFLIASGFYIIYKVSNFFHFAHGIVFTAGAYFAFLFCRIMDMPPYAGIILALLASMILGCLIEFSVYRLLRKRGSNQLVLLLSSLGIYIVLKNLISMVYGDETRSVRTGIVQEGLNILGVRITPIQIITICVSLILVIALSIFLKKTRIGSGMRAVANDPVLANVSGINSNAVILWAFVIGSTLAGLAGILVALDVDMTPTMGMHALMMGVVVVIIGGVNSIPGVALGALLLAMAQHFGVWFIGSQWQDTIAFVILILFLLFRPEGFLGKKVKSATV